MGRQINFYMNEVVFGKCIEYIESRKLHILYHDYKNKTVVNLHGVRGYENVPNIFCLYKPEYGNYTLQKGQFARIDTITSPVMEFSKTLIKSNDKLIISGRLWIETKYRNHMGFITEKNSDLVVEFNNLVKFIKQNVPFQNATFDNYNRKEYINDDILALINQGYHLN